MSNAIDQSKIKTRKGQEVGILLFFGIIWVFGMIMNLAARYASSAEKLGAIIAGIVGMILILGSVILKVKTRHISYGLWCNKCNKFVNRKWNRCSICRTKKVSWKRLPR